MEMELSKELLQFLEGLKQYREILTNPDSKLLEAKRGNELFTAFPFLQEALPKKSKEEVKEEIRENLVRKKGALSYKVIELTGSQYFTQGLSKYDMWKAALNPRIGRPGSTQTVALDFCIDAVNTAIGKLENDIEKGKRDKETGELIEKPSISKEIKTPQDEKGIPLYLFDKMQLHPKVIKASRALFENEHYAQAIFEAFKAVENFVQDKSDLSLYGTNLMEKVFNEENPIIKVPEAGHYYKAVQRGFKNLFIGASQGIRNPKAHKEIIQKDPYITLQYLGFFSFLLKRIDYWEAGVS